MMVLNSLMRNGLVYDHIIATGGIGSGMFFSMRGEHTLGRNESRMATLEPFKDYCKQHIIMHYISVLLGAGKEDRFSSHPIGKVGNDEAGLRLVKMMQEAGMDTGHVSISPDHATLFSVCFQYPDSSGGNITTDASASSLVGPEDVDDFFKSYTKGGRKGIVLAVPEVGVGARIALLKNGRKLGCLNVAAVASAEVAAFSAAGGFSLCDILAINMDEAISIAGMSGDEANAERVADRCMKILGGENPDITVLMTLGAKGSYALTKDKVEFTPALKTAVVSTAGAGDAFIAGLISGLSCGLPLFRGASVDSLKGTPLSTAVDLGNILASFSVNSADTIHEEAQAEALYHYMEGHKLKLSENFHQMFGE